LAPAGLMASARLWGGMSSVPLPEMIRDAGWLAQAYDPPSGQVRFVRMSREDYRAASFLDDRIFQVHRDVAVAPLSSVFAALPADAPRDAQWIFHIGHVGSTLIGRLLGELPGVLSVREPRILRDLAGLPAQERSALSGAVQALLSRSFSAAERPIVKATSFVSEIAPELVAPESRALLVYAEPATYIASILAGENSIKELHALADSRAVRSRARLTLADARTSDAHLAAAAWACEMTSLVKADAALSGRALWVDFDRLLNAVPAELDRMATFLGVSADTAMIERIATGPLMRRYSKDTAYEYSAGLRRELIREAGRRHRQDIADALEMLMRASLQSPDLEKALQQSRMEA
jgi:hypothetical protein